LGGSFASVGGPLSAPQARRLITITTKKAGRPLWVMNVALQCLRDVCYSTNSGTKADILEPTLRAMCGRLRVGKSFFHDSRLGRCSHVFGLLVRYT
jgi:hypothetical protein